MTDVRLTATNPEDSTVVPVSCNAKGELLLEEPIYIEGPQGPKGDKGDDGDPGADGDPFTGNFEGVVRFDGTLRLNKPDDYRYYGEFLGLSACGSISNTSASNIGLVSNGYRNSDNLWTSLAYGGARGAAFVALDPAGDVTIRTAADWPTGSSSYPPLRLQVHRDGAVSIGQSTAETLLDVNGEVTLVSRGVSYTIVEQSGLAHLVPVEQVREVHVDADGVEHPPVEPAVVDRPQLRDLPGEVTMLEQQLQKVMERLKMVPQAGWEVWDGAD